MEGDPQSLADPPLKLFNSSKNRSFEFKGLWGDNTRERWGLWQKKGSRSPLGGHLVPLGTSSLLSREIPSEMLLSLSASCPSDPDILQEGPYILLTETGALNPK